MRVSGEWIENEHTQKVCSVLTDAGFHALFVGGCVRNALIDMPVHDIDIATEARPEQVLILAKTAKIRAIPTGIDHGTVTLVSGGIPHEITTFRHDVETDGRRAVVVFADDILDDAKRRDFTMNALYAGPDGRVIDPLGGLDDLQNRRVRFILDPAQRIREDYLRILRFFRFHAWYGDESGGMDAEGLAAIADNLDGLAQLSIERVGSEIKKLLTAPDPAPAVAAMRATGVLARTLPGADDRALGPLIHLEHKHATAPTPIRRLAALGGHDVAQHLRLSRAEATALNLLRAEVASTTAPHALGYHYGQSTALDILLLRAAMLEMPLDDTASDGVTLGASAVFPVSAADLMPDLQGPALGKRLKRLEQRWIDARFTLSCEQLLASP
jgi:poly(A) polymerase